MCGIAGAFGKSKYTQQDVSNMIALLSHRGNDSVENYIDEKIILSHTRLAIMGGDEGNQPVSNSKQDIITVTNGEIYNYEELTGILQEKGYNVTSTCDTNIIPFLYEEFGTTMFDMLNGQFAIAIWDKKRFRLILARDRFGEKPLYFTKRNKVIYFASEINPLLIGKEAVGINAECLKDICTTWGPIGKKTIYNDIYSVESGEYIIFDENGSSSTKFYTPDFACDKESHLNEQELIVKLDRLLQKSIMNRTKVKTPVAFYLSGGLDSSLITAIAARNSKERLDTFSISFDREGIDESEYQNIMVGTCNTRHHTLQVSENDMIDAFCDCVQHIQTPILRLGVIPMYLLSKFVHESGFRVALSGEGADELFGGYDIFKEAKIRAFCERESDAKERAILYKRTNSYIAGFSEKSPAALAAFFNQIKSTELFSSHALRFQFGNYCEQFFSDEIRRAIHNYSVKDTLSKHLPEKFDEFSNISKAQYIEIITFLENYLLSSQGDRVSMAFHVEGRFPFLDQEIVSFALGLDDKYKIRGLNEKYILKQLAKEYLPAEIFNRKKFPYRALIGHKAFLNHAKISYVLSEEKLNKANIFNVKATMKFLDKIKTKDNISEKELMLLLFLSSTQVIVTGV